MIKTSDRSQKHKGSHQAFKQFCALHLIAFLSICLPAVVICLPVVVICQASNGGSVQETRDASVQDSLRVYEVPAITVQSTVARERESPVVFTEISRVKLQDIHGARDIPQMLQQLPSMMFYSENGNGIGYTNLSMRGFDQRRIAVLINGIPQNDPEDHNVYWINFPDIAQNLQSIQVQRGAGLVNYGAAAIGGSLNLTTSNFADQQFIKISTGAGWQEGLPSNQNTVNPFNRQVSPAVSKYCLEVSSGLVDKYAVYARLSQISSQGYRNGSWAGLTSWFVSAARFDDMLTTQINVFGGPVNDGLAYGGLPKSYTMDRELRRQNLSYFEYDSAGNVQYPTARKSTEIENFSQPHFEVLNNLTLSDNLEIKSSLFYYTGNGFFDYDASWASSAQLGFRSDQNVTNALIHANVDNRQTGWIPRVVWHNSLGQLTAGIEMRFHRSEHVGNLATAEGLEPGFDPQTKIYQYNGEREIMSVFARQVFDLTEDVLINAELQVVRHRYGITNERQYGAYTSYKTTNGTTVGNGGDIFNVYYLFANPRLGLNWNITRQQNFLTSLAYTSREPRRNNLYSGSEAFFGATPRFASDTTGGQIRYDFSSPLVKPERMLDLEMQYSYSTNKLRLSATAYWMEFFDELVKNGRRDVFGIPTDGNAPRTRHLGMELQASYTWTPIPELSIQPWANATISRNQIVDFSYVSSTTTISLNDNPISGFPDLLSNIGIRTSYSNLSLEFSARIIGSFRTDNFGDLTSKSVEYVAAVKKAAPYPNNQVDAATVFNASMVYSMNQIGPFPLFRFKLQVNNIANTLYNGGGNGAEFFPAAERNWYLGAEIDL
ncbi:MAG: TonB-dependent receptor plug domain-containing protein [Ignavibacteria bacterium]|nr:TonB-dependent receptor plug domain-containing protein [Ignavibacteria bacterium]